MAEEKRFTQHESFGPSRPRPLAAPAWGLTTRGVVCPGSGSPARAGTHESSTARRIGLRTAQRAHERRPWCAAGRVLDAPAQSFAFENAPTKRRIARIGTPCSRPCSELGITAAPLWIFAYGSLIFRPGFSHLERRRAYVAGFARRFWQGSPDHRGVPDAPGRVVTLVCLDGVACGGCAYRIDPRDAEAILTALDAREQAGFERRPLPLFDTPGGEPFGEGVTWVAGPTNTHFLGPLPEPEIANVIRSRRGPSGTNTEYVLRLREALRELDVVDEHVERVASLL